MSVYKVNKKRTKNLYIYIQPITKEEETVKTVRRNDVIKEEEEGTLKNNERTMRGLNWAEPSLSFSSRPLGILFPVEREQGVHSTRLRNHKSKWYRFETTMLAEDDATTRSGEGGKKKEGREGRWRKGGSLRAVRSINVVADVVLPYHWPRG